MQTVRALLHSIHVLLFLVAVFPLRAAIRSTSLKYAESLCRRFFAAEQPSFHRYQQSYMACCYYNKVKTKTQVVSRKTKRAGVRSCGIG